jgi:hypothetical protein
MNDLGGIAKVIMLSSRVKAQSSGGPSIGISLKDDSFLYVNNSVIESLAFGGHAEGFRVSQYSNVISVNNRMIVK